MPQYRSESYTELSRIGIRSHEYGRGEESVRVDDRTLPGYHSSKHHSFSNKYRGNERKMTAPESSGSAEQQAQLRRDKKLSTKKLKQLRQLEQMQAMADRLGAKIKLYLQQASDKGSA